MHFERKCNANCLCPFDVLQLGPLLSVHASILLMNADWSGTDWRLTRDLLMASEAEANNKHFNAVNCSILYVHIYYICRSAKVTQNLP